MCCQIQVSVWVENYFVFIEWKIVLELHIWLAQSKKKKESVNMTYFILGADCHLLRNHLERYNTNNPRLLQPMGSMLAASVRAWAWWRSAAPLALSGTHTLGPSGSGAARNVDARSYVGDVSFRINVHGRNEKIHEPEPGVCRRRIPFSLTCVEREMDGRTAEEEEDGGPAGDGLSLQLDLGDTGAYVSRVNTIKLARPVFLGG